MDNLADEIMKLKNLLDAGAITQEEYDEQKKRLLNQAMAPQQVVPDYPPDVPARNNALANPVLMLIASLLCLVGFFLPMVNAGSLYGEAHSTNGLAILKGALNLPSYALLAAAITLFTPVFSAIIAINCITKNIPSKIVMISISFATFVPVIYLAYVLFIPGDIGRYLSSAGVSMGPGLIMMVIGACYYMIYMVIELVVNGASNDAGLLFKNGAIAGLLFGIIMFGYGKIIERPSDMTTFIGFVIIAIGVIVAARFYKYQAGGAIAFHTTIVLGFIFAIVFTLSSWMIIVITNSNISQIPSMGSLVFIGMVFVMQVCFIFSSLTGAAIATEPDDFDQIYEQYADSGEEHQEQTAEEGEQPEQPAT